MKSAPKEIMQDVLNKIRHEHGSVERYVDVVVGLGQEKRERLVLKLKLQGGSKSGKSGSGSSSSSTGSKL